MENKSIIILMLGLIVIGTASAVNCDNSLSDSCNNFLESGYDNCYQGRVYRCESSCNGYTCIAPYPHCQTCYRRVCVWGACKNIPYPCCHQDCAQYMCTSWSYDWELQSNPNPIAAGESCKEWGFYPDTGAGKCSTSIALITDKGESSITAACTGSNGDYKAACFHSGFYSVDNAFCGNPRRETGCVAVPTANDFGYGSGNVPAGNNRYVTAVVAFEDFSLSWQWRWFPIQGSCAANVKDAKWLGSDSDGDGIDNECGDICPNDYNTENQDICHDFAKPVTSISPLPTSNWLTSETTVTLTATDEEPSLGVKSITYKEGNNDWVTVPGNIATLTLGEGMTTVYYYATDNAQHVEDQKESSFKIDTSAPTTPVMIGLPALTKVKDITVQWLPSEDAVSQIAGYELYKSVNDGAWSEPQALTDLSFSESNLADGKYSYKVKAVNGAGLKSGESSVTTVIIDSTAPTTPEWNTANTEMKKLFSNTGKVFLNWIAATDPGLYASGINNYNVYRYSSKIATTDNVTLSYLDEIGLTDGQTYLYNASATDVASNEGTKSDAYTKIIDMTAPTTRMTPASGDYSAAVECSLSVDADVSGVKVDSTKYSVDYTANYLCTDNCYSDVPLTTYEGSFSLTRSGSYLVSYSSEDNAGNVESPKTSTINIFLDYDGDKVVDEIDNCYATPNPGQEDCNLDGIGNACQDSTDPESIATLDGNLGSEGWYKSDVTVTLSATDSPTCTNELVSGVNYTLYKINNEQLKTYSEPIIIEAEGETIVSYYAVDNASNMEEINNTIVFIDKTAPTTTLENTINMNFPVTVRLSADDGEIGSGVLVTYYSIDYIGNYGFKNVPITTVYTDAILLDKTGNYSISYYSIDRAGNRENEPIETSIINVFLDQDSDGVEDEMDDCPTIAGSAQYLGCCAKITVTVENHTIVQGGSNPSSIKMPLDSAISVYNKSCAQNYGLNKQDYRAIIGNCTSIITKYTSDENATANIGVQAGDYILIAKYLIFDPVKEEFVNVSDKHLATPTGLISCGNTTRKYLQLITKYDGKVVPGKRTSVIGSQLDIIEPEYTIWMNPETGETSEMEYYPFILQSADDWTVNVALYAPEGYVASTDTLTETVTNEIEAVQFEIAVAGSNAITGNAITSGKKGASQTTYTIQATHNGKTTTVNGVIPTITAQEAIAKGLEKTHASSTGLANRGNSPVWITALILGVAILASAGVVIINKKK